MVEQGAAMKSWISYDANNCFPLENIPFGAFMNPTTQKVNCCTRVGDFVIDLANLEQQKLFDGPIFSKLTKAVFSNENLNDFAGMGPAIRKEVRASLQKIFSDAKFEDMVKPAMHEAKDIKMRMPVFIRDYTDFYSSKNHAYNVGCMFRGPANALQPNWTHLPVGYHGRASSIVIDGTPVRRPKGQVGPPPGQTEITTPSWSKCNRLDLELEMGTIIGMGNELGTPIKCTEAKQHIFGYTLLNDWSCRDLQVWEYVPLGPFNAKNFASTISPWVITPEALEPFKCQLPEQEPKMMDYLKDSDLSSYNIDLQIHIKTPAMSDYHMMAESNMKYLYYSVAQTIAHHTVTGCNLSAGDMLGSGTISGTEKSQYGSMLELCWKGEQPIQLPGGEERKFLVDGDSINLRGVCKGNGYTIGFGDCEGTILPAHEDSAWF